MWRSFSLGTRQRTGSFDNYGGGTLLHDGTPRAVHVCGPSGNPPSRGPTAMGPEGRVVEIPLHVEQEANLGRLSDEAPLGSRGGTAFTHEFPATESIASGFTFAGSIRST